MPEISNAFVVFMGVGTVFVGLICIVILCKILGAVCSLANPSKSENTQNSAKTASAPVAAAPIENRQEIIAAVSAVIAEELGTDISAIRIHSFKKI